jgi:hypothetical protein
VDFAYIEFGNRIGDAVEVAELMDIVERRHHLRRVDREPVIER